MTVTMALMSGYRDDLQNKLVGGSAAVLAYPLDREALGAAAAQEDGLRRLPGVTRLALVAYGQGSLASEALSGGADVTLRGVGPRAPGEPAASAVARAALDPDRFLPAGVDLGSPEAPGVVLGGELAQRLAVGVGDPVRLVLLAFRDGRPRFSYATLRVAATFDTGFAEYDGGWAVVDLALLERLGGGRAGAGRIYEISLADVATAPEVAAEVEKVLGDAWLVTDWQRLNGDLFTALRLQQWVLFLTLGLIVLVSTFNVASTLVVLVRERMRDIGVLAALGLPPARLRQIFLLYGTALGALGTLLGVGIGSALAWVLDTFELIRFGPEVAAIYFIRAVRFEVVPGDLAAIVAFSLVVTVLACWLPSRRATRVDPSAALRYE
jgi:lipoprotein-releasing system permease protein